MHFIGANENPEIAGGDVLPGKANYLLGNDPAKWHKDVPTYGSILYSSLYPGTDLRYDGTGGQLKGTYTVAAGADPSVIRWRYEGSEKVYVDSAGNLQISVAAPKENGIDTITLTEQKPIAWQESGLGEQADRVPVEAQYVVEEDGTIGFSLGSYDRSLPLIIDPVLAYSTYLGGSNGGDEGRGIALDAAGNAYITGYTGSPTFPIRNGFQGTNGGNIDVFVSKLNSAGSALIYSTYLGGVSNDQGYSIAVDADGSAYITGQTASPGFPLKNAYQSVFRGDPNLLIYDSFVTKLNAAGNDLVFSTFLGGSSTDFGEGIALDGAGSAYVVGYTKSTNFPTITGSYRRTLSGTTDAFVTKFNSTGGAVYSTYLGGTGGEDGKAVAVDANGNAYVTGLTDSTNYPVLNAYQATFQGGTYDAFVTKLNASGSGLIYSTYLGASRGIERGNAIAVDAAGSAYVTGATYSRNFPVTTGVVQASIGGGEWDGFVTKFNPAGNTLGYSTFIGGGARDEGYAIALDADQSAYVTGYTNSLNFPLANAYQSTCNSCGTTNYDAFVLKLNPTATARDYSTYLGGSSADYGYGIVVDWTGATYIAGRSNSTNFPTTAGAFQSTSADNSDAFITKLYDEAQNAPQANECYGGGNPVIYTTQPTGCANSDGINTASGNLSRSDTDILISGRGPGLMFSRTYNSLTAGQNGPLGYGWTHSYNMYIDRDGSNNYLVHQENGSVATFKSDFSHAPRVLATLASSGTDLVFTRIQGQTRFYFRTVDNPNVYRLYRIVDRNNYSTTLSYASGLLRTVTEDISPPTIARTLTLTHTNGLLNEVRDDTGGRTLIFGYTNGDLTSAKDVGDKWTYFTYYTGNHLLWTETNPNNAAITNVYDASGRVTQRTYPMNRVIGLQYTPGAIASSTRITDSLGLVTIHDYRYNRLTQVTRLPGAQQAVVTYTYRPGTNYVSSVKDPLTHITSYTWDANGNLLSETDPLGHTTRYTYTSSNDLDVATNPDNYTTDYDYDAAGNLQSVKRKLITPSQTTDVVTSYVYDPQKPGDVREIIDPRLNHWTFTYDQYGYPDTATNPAPFTNEITDFYYDAVGRQRTVTDPKLNTTTYQYNPYDQVVQVTDPLMYTTVYTYDNVGNPINVTDPKGNTITNTYNLNNELERVTQPDGTYSEWFYDNGGRIDYQTDPLRHVTSDYIYDDLNRLYTVTDALNRTNEYRFDVAGRLYRKQDPQGRYIRYYYYNDDSLQSIDYSDATTPDVSFTYNSRGLRETMQDGTGTTTYGYDSLDRLASVRDGTGRTVVYHHDPADNVERIDTSVFYGDNYLPRFTFFTYDESNRMKSVDYSAGGSVDLGYDLNGNLDTITYPWTTFTQKKIGYDSANQVISTTTYVSNETSPMDVQYVRDVAGLVSSSNEEFYISYGNGTFHQHDLHSYEYDKQGRLVGDLITNTLTSEVLSTTYQYDSASQLTQTLSRPILGSASIITSTRQYDAAGQMYSLREFSSTRTLKDLTLTYDPDGNRRSQRDAVGGIGGGEQVFTYTFNMADQLTTYYNDQYQIDYKYNGDGLRVGKQDPVTFKPITYTWDILGVGAGGLPLMLQEIHPSPPTLNDYYTDSYIYSPGGQPVTREVVSTGRRPDAPDGPGVSDTSKPKSPNPTQPDAPIESGLYYLSDGQGSIRMVRNDVSQMLGSFSYDAYGVRTCTMPAGSCSAHTPFGYTGQYQDEESGLLYLRARYYDPATQQFISRDPLESKTGQPYVYAWGNPVNFVDPSGNAGESLEEQVPPAGIGSRVAAGLAQLRQAISSGIIKPINYAYRGKVFYPKDPQLRAKYPEGVRFTEEGFPDFSPDTRAANEAVGPRVTESFGVETWHHHEDRTTMQLVPYDLHWAVKHTGGEAIVELLGELP